MTIVLAAIAAIAITALGFAGAGWGVSWFMHSHLVWRIAGTAWVQGFAYVLAPLVAVFLPIYAARAGKRRRMLALTRR